LAVVLVASGFILRDYIPDKIRSETSDMRATLGSISTDVGNLKSDVGQIKTDLKDMFNKALERAYPSVPTPEGLKQPGNASNTIERGSAIVEMANNLGIGLDPAIANRFGLEVIAASENATIRDQAWKAMEASLRQRTQQDEVVAAVRNVHWIKSTIPRELRVGLDEFFNQIDTYGSEMTATAQSTWLSVPIGAEDSIKQFHQKLQKLGLPLPAYARFVGKGQATPPFDGIHFSNIVFENLHITYNGGPLILENVTFVNCSFSFQIDTASRSLAIALLTAPRITFRS